MSKLQLWRSGMSSIYRNVPLAHPKPDAGRFILIEDVGIDGKHSFEDAILPVEAFQE
jgi:hypothetical protein